MAAPSPRSGGMLGRYRILEQIGAGGMGVVFRARDERLARDVAIKILHPGSIRSSIAKHRVRNEALALSRLNHPNVETIFEFDSQDDCDFLVMEFIPGVSLDELMKAGPLPQAQAISLVVQLLHGLAAAHEKGIIHRDLKPSNLRLTPDGFLKILDFGLAHCADSEIEMSDFTTETHSTVLAGTLAYMSPEQLRNAPLDPRCDIYSAGLIFYQMCTGQPCFTESGAVLIDAIFNRPVVPPSKINKEVGSRLGAVILKALEKDANARYQSAREMLRDVEALGPGSAARGTSRRISVGMLSAVLLGVLVVSTLMYFFLPDAAGWKRGLATGQFWPGAPSQLAARARVLIGDFENRTGDPVFDDSLGVLLTTGLEQSSHLDLLGASQVGQVIERMRLPANTRIDEKIAREICLRENLPAAIVGSIAKFGDEYLVTVRAIDPEGRALFSGSDTAAGYRQVLTVVDRLQSQLRSRLGESPATLKSRTEPLERVTSGSLEAIQLFSMGRKQNHLGNSAEAEEFMHRAVAVDPQFAMAISYLGLIQLQRQHFNDGSATLRRAVSLAERLTERERYKILGDYQLKVTGNLAEAIAQYRALLDLYPDDYGAHNNLALAYQSEGQWELAIQQEQAAIQQWDGPLARGNLAFIFFLAGNIDRAIETEKSILTAYPAFTQRPFYELGLFNLVRGNQQAAEQYFRSSASMGGSLAINAHLGLADLEASRGKYEAAAEEIRKAILICREQRDPFTEAYAKLQLSRLHLESGDRLNGLRLTKEAAAILEAPPSIAMAGALLARFGDIPGAEAIRRKLEAIQATPWSVQVATELLLARHNFIGASNLIGAAGYPMRTSLLELQARAYSQADHLKEAASAYEQVFRRQTERAADEQDEPSFHCVGIDRYLAGVLYERIGDKLHAKENFARFLEAMRSSDSNAPNVRNAQEWSSRVGTTK